MRYFNGPQYKGKDGRTNWAIMASFDISCDDGLYLRRLRIIQTPWFGVYLHEMHAPDADRDLHDHPYDFYSVILKGGYWEQVNETPAEDYSTVRDTVGGWPRWSGHLMKKTWAHRIINLIEVPTYTLVFVGKRTRDWGFWYKNAFDDKRRWIPWDQYHDITGGEKAV